MNKKNSNVQEIDNNKANSQIKEWFKVDEKAFRHEFFTLWWNLKRNGFKYHKFVSKDTFKIYKKLVDVVFYGNYTTWDEGIMIDYQMGKLGPEKPKTTGSADYFISQIERFNATNPNNPNDKRSFSEESGYKYKFYRYVMHLAYDFLGFIGKKAA